MINTCKYCNTTFEYAPKIGGQPKYCCEDCRQSSWKEAHLSHRARNIVKIRYRNNRQAKDRRTGSLKETVRILLSAAKGRAKKKHLEFNLTLEHILGVLDHQSGRCVQTGVVLTPCAGNGTGSRAPSTISIDRIDSSLGYTKDNVQLVCWWYNVTKANWTEKDMQYYAKLYIAKARPKS